MKSLTDLFIRRPVLALVVNLLILIAGASMGLIKGMIESSRFHKGMDLLRKGAGLLIIGIGLFFLKSQI